MSPILRGCVREFLWGAPPIFLAVVAWSGFAGGPNWPLAMALSILFGLWRCLVLWIKYKEIKAGFGGVVDMENFDKELLIPPAFTITSTVGSMAAFLVAPLGFIAWGVRALFF